MKIRSSRLIFCLSFGLLTCVLSEPLRATVIVDDNFADGDRAKTGALDTNWWTSSSSAADEISVGSLGLVTGGSGRGLHTIFPTQTLSNQGDTIKVTYTFTTPATVGDNRSTAFRVGLFDDLGRAGLNDDVSASSGSPNELYGWGALASGPGTETLPGYMFDMDVNLTDASDDLNFRKHVFNTLTGTGRLMSTTTNFDNISPSGPDEDYAFLPNTEYTGMFSIRRSSATEVTLTGMLTTPTGTISYSNTDAFDSVEFDFLGFHVNSSTFGSSNSAGEPDNGIDFSNIKIEFLVPEPSTLALWMGAFVMIPSLRRR